MDHEQCHICGKLAPLYVRHEISMVDVPAIMIHVCYCKECARMMNEFEMYLSRIGSEKVR